MFETKKLDVQKRQGGSARELQHFEFWQRQGVKLKRKYTPEGQYAKNARRGGGKN